MTQAVPSSPAPASSRSAWGTAAGLCTGRWARCPAAPPSHPPPRHPTRCPAVPPAAPPSHPPPRCPTHHPAVPPAAPASSAQPGEISMQQSWFFHLKKKNQPNQQKKHTFVKAEAFHRAVAFRQTFAKSRAEFWWQPARFPNPVPSSQAPTPGSQDASRLPGLAAPRPRARGRQQAAKPPFPAPAGGHQLQAPPCTGPHAAGIPRLAPRLLSLP